MGSEESEHADNFAGAFEAAFARLQVRLEEACASAPDWPAAVSASVRAAFEFAAEQPTAADTLTNAAMAAGPDGIARRERLLAYAAQGLRPGRALHPGGKELPGVTEQAIAGGLAALIAERVAAGHEAELPACAGEAIQFALTPYLGAEEAHRIGALSGRPRSRPDR